jgi:hypothetical protein
MREPVMVLPDMNNFAICGLPVDNVKLVQNLYPWLLGPVFVAIVQGS